MPIRTVVSSFAPLLCSVRWRPHSSRNLCMVTSSWLPEE